MSQENKRGAYLIHSAAVRLKSSTAYRAKSRAFLIALFVSVSVGPQVVAYSATSSVSAAG